jgi:hypothetical protein
MVKGCRAFTMVEKLLKEDKNYVKKSQSAALRISTLAAQLYIICLIT